MIVAGVYDYIEQCREDYGDEYVDHMLDCGYEPKYIAGVGWRWMLPASNSLRAVRSV